MRYYRWLIVVAVPITLIMFVVRMFTLPWFPALEYKRPGFPEDPLNMPDAERLQLAKACIRFLNLPHDRDILASLRFQDGSVVFINRELDHMDDVKKVYDWMTLGVGVIFILSVAIVYLMIRKGKVIEVYRGLSQGGSLTLTLLLIIGVWMLVGFDAFFTAFHGIFFSEGTWLFYSTDALIRLFPLQFWQDAGMGIAIFVIILAIFLIMIGRQQSKRFTEN